MFGAKGLPVVNSDKFSLLLNIAMKNLTWKLRSGFKSDITKIGKRTYVLDDILNSEAPVELFALLVAEEMIKTSEARDNRQLEVPIQFSRAYDSMEANPRFAAPAAGLAVVFLLGSIGSLVLPNNMLYSNKRGTFETRNTPTKVIEQSGEVYGLENAKNDQADLAVSLSANQVEEYDRGRNAVLRELGRRLKSLKEKGVALRNGQKERIAAFIQAMRTTLKDEEEWRGELGDLLKEEVVDSADLAVVDEKSESNFGELEKQAAEVLKAAEDAAQLPVGGIDLDAAMMDMRIKTDGSGVPLPIELQDIDNVNVPGLSPVILEIMPVIPAAIPILSEMMNSFELKNAA